jgi:hypothetical protein
MKNYNPSKKTLLIIDDSPGIISIVTDMLEELNENNPGMKMRFYIFSGKKEEGHKLANNLNTWPVYTVYKENDKIKLDKLFPVE